MKKSKSSILSIVIGIAMIIVGSSAGTAFGNSFSMRLTTDTPETMPQGRAASWFGEELMKRIPGSEAKVFNASSLYNNADSLEAMHSGTLEASWATLSKISGIIPNGLCLRLPSLFSSYEQVQKIPQTDIGTFITKAAEKKGFILLAWGNLSPFIGVGSRERILKPEDWKGKKIRIYEKHTQLAMVKTMGGNPVVMPWGEFVPSAQSGVVDAGFTSLSSWGKVKETLPYFTSIGMIPDYYVFLVAKRWWDKLDPDTRKIVEMTAVEAAQKQMEWQYEKDQIDIEKLGTKDPASPGFYLLSEAELAPYKEAWIEPIRKIIEEKIGKEGPEALDMTIRLSKEL